MQIAHKIDEFLYELFPEVKQGDDEALRLAIVDFYTYESVKPLVTIADDWVEIEIDTPSIASIQSKFRSVVSLCEAGKYEEAKQLLGKLINQNPTNSEYYRILGQIHSDQGEQDEAINCLIDALRWDPKNGSALLMMGNIFSRFKEDIPTAMKYYDQALVANPKDNVTLNNIGANLMQQGQIEEAKKYFYQALEIDREYPNTLLALSLLAEKENDNHEAFQRAIAAVKYSVQKDVVYQNAFKQAVEIAKREIKSDMGKITISEFKQKLEFDGDRRIEIVEAPDLPTAAKIEFAENYDRPNHLVKFKPEYPAVEHLILHEFVHLQLVIEARKESENQLFISHQAHQARFMEELKSTITEFQKMGLPEDSIESYCESLFQGLNSQIFNAPIDLFIEDFLFQKYERCRPYQFLSLYNLLQEGIKAVTDKKIVELSPKKIISKSKVYNLIGALHFKELFGLDLTDEYKASANEIQLAKGFYEEFLEYRNDKEPGEEYELVLHWAEDLGLDQYFDLVNEQEYRDKGTNLDNILESIEQDPYDLHTTDRSREREQEKFEKTQEEIGTNMAVVMFMVEALEFFESFSKEKIKKIAFEIAMQGTQGFDPDKKGYRISTIPGKQFSGYHILAYYYVSWALAIPEMLSQLQMPYDEEYELAKSMYKPKSK